MKSFIARTLKLSIPLAVTIAIVFFSINKYVEQSAQQYILTADTSVKTDAILVLGAYVYPDGRVSDMLNDRLSIAEELYACSKSDKIIVSGDHGQEDYDEVNAMKLFLKDKNILPSNIFMDHAGFSTYESIYRARDIFKVKKMIIVTQGYHLSRAIFIARELGIEAYGIASDPREYNATQMRNYKIREVAARNKDFFLAKFIQPKPTFLGDTIPINGDGNITDDHN
ncbi:SanA/YdcF family protein [Anaerosinus massiliensis]|uniref:SanA/YdcF family protein n=1 Tax=Massilibacillus massiliensis TaxID=1806837 RepID=UPI000AFD918B|nr:ElyC/SanA/YdcF family protein [Massilibacillus massiliensis]